MKKDKKYIYLIVLIFFIVTLSLSAQKEANIWYFGGQAGLDFNSGVLVPLIDGSMRAALPLPMQILKSCIYDLNPRYNWSI